MIKSIQMKRSTHPKAGIFYSRSFVALLVSAMIFLAGCSDDENVNSAEAQKIVGTFQITDTDEWDEVETYSIGITHKGGADLEITNFADIMYVPVKATLKSNKLTIPSQTFKGKTMTIVVQGSGTFDGVSLNFNYTIDSGDGYIFEHSCQGVKAGS